MSGYGVDTPDWAALPWAWAAQRLLANRNYWVVTASADGRPHAMPVWGVWDNELMRFAFSCAPSARKVRNITANPRSVIMIEDTVECVSIEGTARVVDSAERQAQWVERYLGKYRPISSELSAEFLQQNLIIEFEPERAFGVIERAEEFATRATRWVFRG